MVLKCSLPPMRSHDIVLWQLTSLCHETVSTIFDLSWSYGESCDASRDKEKQEQSHVVSDV